MDIKEMERQLERNKVTLARTEEAVKWIKRERRQVQERKERIYEELRRAGLLRD